MAARELYKDGIEFAVLALQSPAFNQHLKANGQLDFSNSEAVQQLTKSLLERDFKLKLDLPKDRLCPPVPNRLNYILWIQDLLDTTGDSHTDSYDSARQVIGLDIGTGASCIYPLLGCSQRPNWRFAATDIDEQNMACARRNILQNNLKSRIRPLLTKASDKLIPLDALNLESIDITMCNPPFYASSADLLASAAAKSRPPHSACTGADVEMVTPGGEVAFVNRMIEESKLLKERCQWYTTMVGKYSSVEVIIGDLRKAGVDNWAVKDLVQGNKTRRWAIAWSWGHMRPNSDTARGTSTLSKHLLPFPSETHFTVPLDQQTCETRLNQIMSPLDMQWEYRPTIGLGSAPGNVWSRAARRKKQHNLGSPSAGMEGLELKNDEDETGPALVFKITLRLAAEGSVQMGVRWLKGKDSVIYESFCGMLKRQLTSP